ncbi:methyltransferase [Kineobactrum sediminis]|uniref:Methyltransferase n=1 Tax=Kineobactrum sediminis TaxID=1905677 RepID=A0A2N5Y4H9_9GAMM|nr:class I SAM-dependent methyltransferase [Kineobactrum sediminis]PLW83288.1 methyltransferase [Kineobactrum sediminis]
MKYSIALVLALIMAPAHAALDWKTALQGDHRADANKIRDVSRNPRETLEFFGIREGMTVVELSPGGGWYTEILAPLIVDNGTLYAAHFGLNAPHSYYRNALGKYLQKLAANHDLYGPVIVTQLAPPEETTVAPADSADLVLAFRNIHSWMGTGTLEQTLAAAFTALRPGGVLGVVQHRAQGETTPEEMAKTGYVDQDYLVQQARAAGFKLDGSSEINANPLDTADHPAGVWSLPPALRGGEVGRDNFVEIGESDRMTLRFVKPE